MNSFDLAVSVVSPLLFTLIVGYFLKMVKIFNGSFLKQLNNLCFKVFLPILLFLNVYNSDFSKDFSWELLLFAIVVVIVIFAVLTAIVPIICKDNNRRGVYIQGIFRSNFILFGLPIIITIFGAENTGIVSILVAFIVPLFNLLSVIVLNIFSKEHASFKSILKGVALNPLILASIVGFIFVFTGIKMPSLLYGSVQSLSNIATPLAFIILGGSFDFSSVKKNILPIINCVAVKLILIPLIVVPIAVAFKFSSIAIVAIFAMLASPTAVSTYTMAQSMNQDGELAGQIVVFTSVLSMLTIFAGILIISAFGLI